MKIHTNGKTVAAIVEVTPTFDMLEKSDDYTASVVSTLEFDSKKVVAKAVCHDEDAFDLKLGTEIAKMRLDVKCKSLELLEWKKVEKRAKHILKVAQEQQAKLKQKMDNVKRELEKCTK